MNDKNLNEVDMVLDHYLLKEAKWIKETLTSTLGETEIDLEIFFK